MKIEAVRDDGALLISHGRAAAIISEDGIWLTTVVSALARGYWDDPGPKDKIPPRQVASLIRALKEHESQLPPPNPFLEDGDDDN